MAEPQVGDVIEIQVRGFILKGEFRVIEASPGRLVLDPVECDTFYARRLAEHLNKIQRSV